MILLASIHGTAWWSVHVWDSNNTTGCDHYVSMVLYKGGVCKESSWGGDSRDDCISFTDTSAWDTADAFLNGDNGSLNTQNANMTLGGHHYYTVGKLLTAALAFCVIGVIFQLACGFFAPMEMHKKLQLANAFLVFICLLLILSGISMSHNDLNDPAYWQLLYCPAIGANTTTSNSYSSGPVGGYSLAIITFIVQFTSLSFLLSPGNCCFCCPCQQFCGCVEYKQPMAEQAQATFAVPANAVASPVYVVNTVGGQPAAQQPTVIVGKVVDYA
jgi:hypothetical protein